MGYWEGQDSVPRLKRDIVDQMRQAACVYETYVTVHSAA